MTASLVGQVLSIKYIKHEPIQWKKENQKLTTNKEIIFNKINEFIEKTNFDTKGFIALDTVSPI